MANVTGIFVWTITINIANFGENKLTLLGKLDHFSTLKKIIYNVK
jgi:hypothetical protein